MTVTEMDLTTRQYNRERYACHVRLGDKRQYGDFGDAQRENRHIVDVMTRWLARCVRDELILTGRAHIEIHRDFMTDRLMLRAWAYAFQNVSPGDAEALSSHIEDAAIVFIRGGGGVIWRSDYQDPSFPGVTDRVRNVLRRNGIVRLSEALALSDTELLGLGGSGPKTVAEIRAAAIEYRDAVIDSEWPSF